MTKVSEWLPADDTGVCRVILGTHPAKVENRVAFIEKTPRVRARDSKYTSDDWVNWVARPGKGSGPNDQESRDWCDAMLVLLGYDLPDHEPQPMGVVMLSSEEVKDVVLQRLAPYVTAEDAGLNVAALALVVADRAAEDTKGMEN